MHCHRVLCCVAADVSRREDRREQSRARPSKKKRDRIIRSLWNGFHVPQMMSLDNTEDELSTIQFLLERISEHL